MRTDDLVQALVADRAMAQPPIASQLAMALGIGFAVSATAFLLLLGPRPDIAWAAGTVRFDVKIVQVVLLAVTAVALVLRVARPGTATGWPIIALAPALLAIAVIAELIAVPSGQWIVRLVGSNAMICLTAIPLLSLPLLAAFLVVLRRGAPLSRTGAGAVAGLAAGGVAAALYAMHCTDDSPLFVAFWYPVAIGGVTVLGALLGRVLLRW
jgi:hypothetical protein